LEITQFAFDKYVLLLLDLSSYEFPFLLEFKALVVVLNAPFILVGCDFFLSWFWNVCFATLLS
jgi:hypothetical protein